MDEDTSPLLLKLSTGRELTVDVCNCNECKNEFFVPEFSNGEGDPKFCPFCGVKFTKMCITSYKIPCD